MQYALDIANALVFLKMQGYLHTELSSAHIMITSHDTAKLADVGSCVQLAKQKQSPPKEYDVYSPEPQYVNIDGECIFNLILPDCAKRRVLFLSVYL